MTYVDLLIDRLPLAIGIALVLSIIGSFVIRYFVQRAEISTTIGSKSLYRDVQSKLDFDADRPIRDRTQDRLGFTNVAAKLADAVVASTASEGLVIGIEGEWGSGKSSILNLLADRLRGSRNVSVIRFEPWVIAERDAMVAALMGSLAHHIDELREESKGPLASLAREATNLSKQFRVYGATSSRFLSRVARLGGSVGLPSAPFAEGFETLGELLDEDRKSAPLAEQREELSDDLRHFGHRFIVIIDDVDRLEPQEAVEVTRVVRAVGDLPNIVYLLSYDRKVLADSLHAAISVDDGDAYLQKIVQVTFSVPRPEEFDLRRWFHEECLAVAAAANNGKIPESDVAERLASVCDKEGSQLRTPRSVVLVLNAIRLVYPSVVGQVDFADLVWVQITRIINPQLYQWVEEYLTKFAAVIEGFGYVDGIERKGLSDRLSALIPDDDRTTSPNSIWQLKEVIPGLAGTLDIEAKLTVLNSIDRTERRALEKGKRLGSPYHYRFYFSFSAPSGALSDSTIELIISAAKAGHELLPMLQALSSEKRPQGGTMYGVFLDRIARLETGYISPEALRRLVSAIADTVDDDENRQPRGGAFGMRTSWRAAHYTFASALKQFSPTERKEFIRETFTNRTSIGWLLEELIGRELFSHGRVGNRAVPDSERMFANHELDLALSEFLPRLEGRDRTRIIDRPELLGFLYRWGQATGDFAKPRNWVEEQILTDQGLLSLLERFRGWRATGKRVFYPLKRSDLEQFFDVDAMLTRLTVISHDLTVPAEARAKASDLIEAVRQGDA